MDELIPRLKGRIKDYALLDAVKTIVTGRQQGATWDNWNPPLHRRRQGWQDVRMSSAQFTSLIGFGRGRHVFSSSAIKRGITTILEEGNPHLQKSGAVVPL